MAFLAFLAVVAVAAEPPFEERLLLAVAGPGTGALLGTGVVGLLLWKVTDRVQRRRAERELKLEVLTDAFTVATKFYMELNRFKRVSLDPSVPDKDKATARVALDKEYLHYRAASLVLEARMEAIFEAEDPASDFKSQDADRFESKVPAIVWHQIDDLQTVRYMNLTNRAASKTYETNSRGYDQRWHTGLTKDELENGKDGDADRFLISTYRGAMKTLRELLLETDVVQVHRRKG